MAVMMTLRELSHNTSAVLDRVEHGETIEVMRYGRVIAVLSPVGQRRTSRDELVAAGVLTGPGQPGSARKRLGPAVARPDGGRGLSDILADLRDEDDR